MTRPPSPSLAHARISLSRLRGRGTSTPKAGQGEGGRALALLSALLLSACGLQPIYAGGAHGPAASALSRIEIAPIPDRAGYLLRQQLRQRLDPGDRPAYRLDVTLDDKITGFGIRVDTSIARERRTLRARYQLIEKTTNAVLLDATAGSDEGIDVVQSEYAVVAAEQTALERLSVNLSEQITARLALFARQRRHEMPDAVPGGAPLPPSMIEPPGDAPSLSPDARGRPATPAQALPPEAAPTPPE